MTSIEPVGQRLDQREAFVLAAQRRVQLQEGAVVADVDFVEGEIVDRDAAGDGEAGSRARARCLERQPLETSAA